MLQYVNDQCYDHVHRNAIKCSLKTCKIKKQLHISHDCNSVSLLFVELESGSQCHSTVYSYLLTAELSPTTRQLCHKIRGSIACRRLDVRMLELLNVPIMHPYNYIVPQLIVAPFIKERLHLDGFHFSTGFKKWMCCVAHACWV